MPVSSSSRYQQQDAYPAPAADGTLRPTLPIRRTPAPVQAAYRHRVSGVEDLEYVAWHYLGNSEAWWVVADRNPVAFPLDLAPGAVLDVPLGERPGPSDRARVFG